MRLLIIALCVVTLTGCTTAAPRTDMVSFDRAAFAFTYADWYARLKADCVKSPKDDICTNLGILDAQIRKEVIDAPAKAAAGQSASPLDSLLPLLMKLAPLAAGL